jgi:hypothetical protein
MADPTAIVEAFATWAKRRGIPGRDVEHRRTAKELLILSNGQRPKQEHLEQLAADYREAFHAPNQIVVACEIGTALRQWACVEGAAHFGGGGQLLPPLDPDPQPPSVALDLELPKPPSAALDLGPANPSSRQPEVAVSERSAEPPPPKPSAPKRTIDSKPAVPPPPPSQPVSTPSRPRALPSSARGADEATPADYDFGAIDASTFPIEADSASAGGPSRIDRTEPTEPVAPPPPDAPDASADASPRKPPRFAALSRKLAGFRGIAPRLVELAVQTSPLVWVTLGVFVAVCCVLIARPSWVFAPERIDVSGPFSTRQLGIELDLGTSPWAHAARRDTHVDKNGWERSAAVLFRGTNWNDFSEELTVLTFERGAVASADDARQLGSAELSGAPLARNCRAFKHTQAVADGTLCSSFSGRGSMRLSQVEAYFALRDRVVFVRWLKELPAAASAKSEPPTDVSPDTIAKAESLFATIGPRK